MFLLDIHECIKPYHNAYPLLKSRGQDVHIPFASSLSLYLVIALRCRTSVLSPVSLLTLTSRLVIASVSAPIVARWPRSARPSLQVTRRVRKPQVKCIAKPTARLDGSAPIAKRRRRTRSRQRPKRNTALGCLTNSPSHFTRRLLRIAMLLSIPMPTPPPPSAGFVSASQRNLHLPLGAGRWALLATHRNRPERCPRKVTASPCARGRRLHPPWPFRLGCVRPKSNTPLAF